ncbi:MAG: HD domain-containing phosphohydrolase [Candidatus Zhuqueibacterota bacterium]
MYLNYWRLKRKPFENSFEPDFFFLSENTADALNRLTYCISEQKQLASLTGDYGTGKTYLLQNLFNKYSKDNVYILSLSAVRHVPGRTQQQFILDYENGDFAGNTRLESVQEIMDFLLEKARSGQRSILIIDEMQLIEDDNVFEDIRMLLNTNFEYHSVVTVILAGHTSLQQTLVRLPQLQQRLTVNCYLRPYTDVETASFIKYRLRQAGSKENMFTGDAMQKIHQISNGLPRKINNVCDLALVLAFMRKHKPIDADIIDAINNENDILFKQPELQAEQLPRQKDENAEIALDDERESEPKTTKLAFDTLVENARARQSELPPLESWPGDDSSDAEKYVPFRFSPMKQLHDEKSSPLPDASPLEKLIQPNSVTPKMDGLKNAQNFQAPDPLNKTASPTSERSDAFNQQLSDYLAPQNSARDLSFSDSREQHTLPGGAEEFLGEADPLMAQDEEDDLVDLDDIFQEEMEQNRKADSGVIPLGDDLNWTLTSFIFPTVTEFFQELKAGQPLNLDRLNMVVETIINITREGDELITRLFDTTGNHSMEEHSINVAGLSAAVALALNMSDQEVEEVVLSALLHDIGIMKIDPEIVFKKGTLQKHELEIIKEHPYMGAEMLHKIRSDRYASFLPTLRTVILQEHEREGGIGYPLGLHGDEIHKYAKIIGLCDVFEASCFRRKERKSTLVHNTLKKIIDLDVKYFSTRIKKGLVKKLTLYPLHSYVQLNSGEIGCVVKVNQSHPLRPILEMVADSDRNRLPAPETRDLLKTPFLFIENVVDKEDVF